MTADLAPACLAALTAKWAGRADFCVVDTGFGQGQHFLATRRAWLADPAGPQRLHYVGIASTPVPLSALVDSPAMGLAPDQPLDPALKAALVAHWPPAVPGWHTVDLDHGRLQLTLVFGEPRTVARALDCRADAIALGGFNPSGDAWPAALLSALARRASADAIAYGGGADPALQASLRSAGFGLDAATGVAHFAPRATVRRPPAHGSAPGCALIVGAGLAGGWAAHALTRQGWSVTVFDRQPQPAREASGNPAGLFHGTVLPDDGPHARFHRAAALAATHAMAPWIADGRVAGRLDGLLRLAGESETPASLQSLIERHKLPVDYVQVLDRAAASARAGIALDRPAWFYPGGGWVDPGALVRHLLADADVKCSSDVAGLRRLDDRWQLLDREGRPMAQAGTLVLANAADAARLWPAAGWPIGRSRGQISVWPQVPAGAPVPRVPITGGGYVVALDDGSLLCGATAAAGDETETLRDADHRFNLDRLLRLTGWAAPWPASGRVAWRAMTPDRLPLVGAVPAQDARPQTRPDRVARTPGLFVLSALGSRGLTWGPLAARMLAAWVSGAPMPVEASLRDAVDPARWQVRAARRGAPPR